MLNVLLSGAAGAMGKNVSAVAAAQNDIKIVAGVDRNEVSCGFPIFSDFASVNVPLDVIIDFSNVSALEKMLDYAEEKKIPVVIATTGYSDKQLERIKAAAKVIPIFKTANFSLGVNVLISLVKRAAAMMPGFDIEVVEKHHHNKLDAPSGTALMLADAANAARGNELHFEFDRHSKRAKRDPKEIGVHSIRGGTIVGEHDVIFAGENEVITLSHNAESRAVFAAGAISAARFIVNKKAGLYNMNDLLGID
ncbi:MAG: 4-hydroxy-tetrahydrodipicolinate reductase [Clostridia bacterium]|nr:4-hydroxy-tetrahydrodipicolinate reductase [Clostridia bacterium]